MKPNDRTSREPTNAAYDFRFPPFFFPIPPITSPFFARTPSRADLCPISLSNAPPFDFVTDFAEPDFLFLSFFPSSMEPVKYRM